MVAEHLHWLSEKLQTWQLVDHLVARHGLTRSFMDQFTDDRLRRWHNVVHGKPPVLDADKYDTPFDAHALRGHLVTAHGKARRFVDQFTEEELRVWHDAILHKSGTHTHLPQNERETMHRTPGDAQSLREHLIANHGYNSDTVAIWSDWELQSQHNAERHTHLEPTEKETMQNESNTGQAPKLAVEILQDRVRQLQDRVQQLNKGIEDRVDEVIGLGEDRRRLLAQISEIESFLKNQEI